MKLHVHHGLPAVAVLLKHGGYELKLTNVIIDTGAAVSIFRTDDLMTIGLKLEPQDELQQVHGVGGTEFVVVKQVDQVAVGDLTLENFRIDMGAMNYGFGIDGLLGFDFLQRVGAVLDFKQMEIRGV